MGGNVILHKKAAFRARYRKEKSYTTPELQKRHTPTVFVMDGNDIHHKRRCVASTVFCDMETGTNHPDLLWPTTVSDSAVHLLLLPELVLTLLPAS